MLTAVASIPARPEPRTHASNTQRPRLEESRRPAWSGAVVTTAPIMVPGADTRVDPPVLGRSKRAKSIAGLRTVDRGTTSDRATDRATRARGGTRDARLSTGAAHAARRPLCAAARRTNPRHAGHRLRTSRA